MLHQSRLIPAHALPVTRAPQQKNPREIPKDLRGTRQAIFFLLRRAAVQPGPQTATPARTPRSAAAPVMDADHFVFQF